MILLIDNVILTILGFVFALGLIVLIHEGGHFFFARRANILCREYAFGMGPILLKKKKGETLYALRAFPIGGFCAIAGEEVEENLLASIKEVRLLIEDGVVKKFIIDDNNHLFDKLPKYKIINYDIFDETDSGNLFIVVEENGSNVEYKVDPQAMYVITKKLKNDKDLKDSEVYLNNNDTLEIQRLINKYSDEIQIAPHNRTLNAKSKTARALVMFGGPLMNFILAILMFFIVGLLTGFVSSDSTKLAKISSDSPAYNVLQENDIINELYINHNGDKISSGDITNNWKKMTVFLNEYKKNEAYDGPITVVFTRNKTKYEQSITPFVIIYSISMIQDLTDKENVRIGDLDEKSLAYKGGLRTGDVILAIRYKGEELSENVFVDSWKDVYTLFTKNEQGKEMIVTVLRNAESIEATVNPYSKEIFDKTQNVSTTAILMGISPKNEFSIIKSVEYAFTESFNSIKKMINTLGMLFSSSEIGIGDLSGPVGIFSMTSQYVSQGFSGLFYWVGFLSINVGLMNLLPVPALDGGRLVFVAYEAITKRKPSEKIQTILITVTMLLLFGLIIFVSFNDILRLIGVK